MATSTDLSNRRNTYFSYHSKYLNNKLIFSIPYINTSTPSKLDVPCNKDLNKQ
jgi:hypothetical protein